VPGATPVTEPPVVIVATAVFELLHVPPETPSVRLNTLPTQRGPVMPEILPADGVAVTATL